MSLILDALNRSQRERDSGNKVPGIETQHTPEPLQRSNVWAKLLPWAGLVAALCVIVWLLWRGDETREVPVSTVIPPTVKTAPVPVPVPEVEPPTVKKVAAVVRQEKPMQQKSAVEDLYKNQVDEKSAAPAVAKKPAEHVEEPVQQVNTEQTIDIEKMLAAAKAEAENVGLTEHSAPFLSELSQQTRDKVPTIYYTRHDYFGGSSGSTVTLNGEAVQAGARLPGSLSVEEILPDSVVLNYRGTQFRLRALNSWINL